MEIKYFDRVKGAVSVEKIYGDQAIKWFYGSNLGKILSPIVASACISKLYGLLQSTPHSKKKIEPFIEKFNIDQSEFMPEDDRSEIDPYSNFNNFFIRRFKDGKRDFVQENSIMPAFAEARYFGYETIDEKTLIPVKGIYLKSSDLLVKSEWGKVFNAGPLLLARLCPVDYHRFHFPDNGKVLDHYRVHGKLHSVNPIALKKKQNIFLTNERQVTILQTANFKKLAYIEVGATCVGKIVQTTNLSSFSRGEEKGYFLFGGSTVIVVGEPGSWIPEPDILENSNNGMETLVQLGDRVANSLV